MLRVYCAGVYAQKATLGIASGINSDQPFRQARLGGLVKETLYSSGQRMKVAVEVALIAVSLWLCDSF